MIFAENISKEKLKNLPLLRYQGKIHVIDRHDQVWEAIQAIKKEPVVGFDTEKKPTFKKGQFHHTALLQFAIPEEAYLFRINKLGFHPGIKTLLENEHLKKVGLGLKDDISNLAQFGTYTPAGFVELIQITKSIGIKQSGLRNLAAIFFDQRISKNQQTSNWENEVLTTSQQQYAALDAGLCLDIYLLLQKKGFIQ